MFHVFIQPTSKRRFLALPVVSAIALFVASAQAEQTIGVQPAGTPASATARVNVRVTVPKVVILRVGAADATISDVDFTVGLSPAVAGAPGNSLAYSGAIPPALATTVATTNPTTAPTNSAAVLTTGAWTNVAGTNLSCALSTLSGATPFAAGATTSAGVPGTNDIRVEGTTPAHPGTSLGQCDGTTSTPIAPLTALSGTFTYTLALASNAVAAGSYGNVVTYTAATP